MVSKIKTKKQKIKVSFYIPCFNAEDYIERCIESILKQTYPVGEIIIVDDGCQDKTIEKALKYNVKIIKNKKNKGLAFSRNRAIEEARNNIIASVDSDVILDKRWLENLIKNFKNKNTAGVGGNLEEKYVNNLADLWRKMHMKQNWGKNKIINPKFLFGSNSILRKDAIIKIGLYSNMYKRNYEDVDISKRLKKAGYKIIYEPNARATHLKKDSIKSVLKSSWRWTLFSYCPPSNIFWFLFRFLTDTYKFIKYFLKDVIKFRFNLIFVDLLILPSHFFFNFDYLLKERFLKYKHHSRLTGGNKQ
jgi:cellulose synthase/poly-beta-1,6-N-acetylglucosamine synthase-like glycosyltransferase